MTMRSVDVASGGMVLPSAWNMLDVTNVMPDGTKVNTYWFVDSQPVNIGTLHTTHRNWKKRFACAKRCWR